MSIDYIGDLNGDGFEDIVVGTFTDDDGGLDTGVVYILFRDANSAVINATKISKIRGAFIRVLDNDDRFGGAVSFLGDLNDDGFTEIAVSADYDGDAGYSHGTVLVLSLNSDGTLNSHSKINDTQRGFNEGIVSDATFGTDIENIGDLNGDDWAVGFIRDSDWGARRGVVWILCMNTNLTVNSEQKISDTKVSFSAV
ncbi:integrin alpha [Olleya sp. Bg11-27]|uniref:integrin alpha n=1 Tax=Olleya sp. Bg11-27 TaxID=2058135 RepID=UPI000C316A4C|nr:integrin alpha [Olleya sp. Bg11-27]AUC75487.1 hypothetical protein CW732_07265 [Olleya sp. Bg11-27]